MYHSIIVPLDGSALAERALALATRLATQFGAELQLVHVHRERVADELATYGLTGAAARTAAENYLLSAADRLRTSSGGRVAGTVLDGSPAAAIVAHAERTGADLIVMSSHGRTGASRFWLGSVADVVIRSATIPVLLVRGTADSQAFARVLVPVDGSAASEAIVPHAIALAKPNAAHVHLLQVEERAEDLRTSVWSLAAHEPDDLPNRLARADKYLHGIIAQFETEWAPATVSAEARGAHRVGEAIAQVAIERETDLIAMSTRGRGASRVLIGSVADKVIRGTECSLLLSRTT